MKGFVRLGGLVSGAAAVFLWTTTAVAAPLPQDFNLKDYISELVNGRRFSTELRGRVAAARSAESVLGSPPSCSTAGSPPRMEIFMVNKDQCVEAGETTTYRLVVRNTGDQAAYNVQINFNAPDGSSVINSNIPQPFVEVFNGNNHMEEYSVTVRFDRTALPATAVATVIFYDCQGLKDRYNCQLEYLNNCFNRCDGSRNQDQCFDSCEEVALAGHTCNFSRQVATQHTMKGESCGQPDIAPEPLPTGKFPAIICGPGDRSCAGFMPPLGINFQNARSWADNPILGPRFREAIADIIPGECRVIDDDIIVTDGGQRYHDALNRMAKPADDFMFPLYESGRDFSRLVLDNELLGIEQKLKVRDQLGRIHTKYWQDLADGVGDVLAERTTTANIRTQLPRWLNSFNQEIRQAQQQNARAYQAMQRQRLAKFDPVAQQAVANARESILRACPPPPSDGGLSQLLPPVKEAYESLLNDRQQAYDATQRQFMNPPSAVPEAFQATTWQRALEDALAQYDRNNKEPLQQFLVQYPPREREAFVNVWTETYGQHAAEDRRLDDELRLARWEVALDTPKQVATTCEKEKVFAPPVETSWCESGEYPEFVIRGAPRPAKEVHPPVEITGGERAIIEDRAVMGDTCGGKPGDPYWADDCSCHCDEIIPGNGPVLEVCGNNRPITRHDINVTSEQECMLDMPRHGNPYF